MNRKALTRYHQENAIDLMIMGAYGYSRNTLFVGSTTTEMIRNSTVPLLLLR